MIANTRFGLALLLLLATTSLLRAQAGRHVPVPRPMPRPGQAPTPVPGRMRPGYVGQDNTPNQPSTPDKRWGVLVILGVFAVPIVIVILVGKRSQQAKQVEGLNLGAPTEAVPDLIRTPESVAEAFQVPNPVQPQAGPGSIIERPAQGGGFHTLDH